MISVREAQERVLEGAGRLSVERVALLDALGRILAEDITSDIDIAPFDNSAMDGYAVRAGDVAGATAASPAVLSVVDHIRAGVFPTKVVGEGEAARIMTGAPMPPGADAVVMVEKTQAAAHGGEGDAVAILEPVALGENVRYRGEEVRRGDVILAAGERLGSPAVGLAASVGSSTVAVYRRPRVAIVSTGDELVDIDEVPGPGQIRNANSFSLAAAVLQAGGEPHILGVARDTEAQTRALLERAAEFDIMISSGGVSMGDFDVVKRVLGELGELTFWKIAMRPGAPNAFGTIGGTPFFGLPGNPTSAMVGFELFVRPLMRKMAGHTALMRPTVAATLEHDISKMAERHFFLRGRLGKEPDGAYTVALAGSQSSALLTTLHRSNCLVSLAQGETTFPAGTVVTCIRFDADEDFV